MKVKTKVKIRKKQETIKNREWERERRGKLNVAFGQLDQLLPDHDPSRARSKVATLLASIGHITHLQQLVATLSGQGGKDATQRDNVYVAELARLHERIDTLRARCQQLAQLLQMADIPVPQPRAAKEKGAPAQPKWNGNIGHKTVQKRIINSRKEKAEKKENKEISSTAVVKKKQPVKKKIQQTITKSAEVEENEPLSKLQSNSKHPSSIALPDCNELSPVKKVIDLCNTPLRELTGFTLNSASVATTFPTSSVATSFPSCAAATSSISSASPSSLSSNSPGMPDTPSNEGQSSDGVTTSLDPSAGEHGSMMESAKTVTTSLNGSCQGSAMEGSSKTVTLFEGDDHRSKMEGSKNVSADFVTNTVKKTSTCAENEQGVTDLQTSSEALTKGPTLNQSPMEVGTVTTKSPSVVVDTPAAVAVTNKSLVEVGAFLPKSSSSTGSDTLAVTASTVTFGADKSKSPSTVAVTSTATVSPLLVAGTASTVTVSTPTGVVTSLTESPSEQELSESIEDKPNSATSNTATNSPQVPKKNVSPKTKHATASGSKPVMVTSSATPIPVTGTVHVVNGMNTYPNIMPVTVTNFAAPTINPSIMIVLADGRVVSVPQQPPIQQQFVINPAINHQSPTTIVIGNSAPVIEPLVFETDAASVTNRAGQKRVLLSKHSSNKVPIPMVGTQFVMQRTVKMKVREESRVIEKCQKRMVKKKVVAATTKVADNVKKLGAKKKLLENACDKSRKQQEGDKMDTSETGENKLSKTTNKDVVIGQTNKLDENDPSNAKVLSDSRVNPENVHPAEHKMSQNLIKSTEQDSLVENNGKTTTKNALIVVEKADMSSVAKGSSALAAQKSDSLSRNLILKPVQKELGGENVDEKRQLDDLSLMKKPQNENQHISKKTDSRSHTTTRKVRNVEGVDDRIDDNVNDCFGLDNMSDDDNDDGNMTSSAIKRPADSNDGPMLKNMKMTEEQNLSNKTSLVKEVVQQETSNMVAPEVFSGNIDDVRMVSDVCLDKSPNLTSDHIKPKNAPNEQRKSNSCINTNNCDGSILDRTSIDNNKNYSIKNKEGKVSNHVVSNQIEMNSVDSFSQQQVGSSYHDNGNTSSVSNTHQVSAGNHLEIVASNKYSEGMMLGCHKTSSVKEYGSSDQVLSQKPTVGVTELPGVQMACNVEMNSVLCSRTDQNPGNLTQSITETIKEGTSKTSLHPSKIFGDNNVMGNNTIPLQHSPCSTSKNTSCVSMLTSEAMSKNVENTSGMFPRDTSFSERGLLPSAGMSKVCIGITGTTQAVEQTTREIIQERQNIDQSVVNGSNFINGSTSNQQVKTTSYIEGSNQQKKIEMQTQTQATAKIDNNFGSLQQIGVTQGQVRQSVESTTMITNSQIVSGFDSNMTSTVTSNYMNRNLPAIGNLFWNSEIIPSQAVNTSASMFSDAASNQNINQNLRSLETGNNFKNYSNTNSASSTSITPTTTVCSSSVLPNFSMPMLTRAAANQNVISSSNQNPLKPSESVIGGNFINYPNITLASTICTTKSTTSVCASNKTSLISGNCSSSKLTIISEQRPIVSYKISDTSQKTMNTNPASNVLQVGLPEKQCNFNTNLHKGGEGGSNYFQPGYKSVVKQCDNCNSSGLNKSLNMHGCEHQQTISKTVPNQPLLNASKTGETSKTASVYNAGTKIIGTKMKKDMSTNTSTEQPKVLYSSQKTFVGSSSSHDVARKQLEAVQDKIGTNRSKDKNIRKVMKKTVSQQTDDGSVLNVVGKTDLRKVAIGCKMKSSSGCQTVESVSTRTRVCEKYQNSFGRGVVAQNKRKQSTFQVGYTVSGKSCLQVGNSVVANSKKSAAKSVASTGDTLPSIQHNNMEMISGLVSTSTQNNVVPFKTVSEQANMFASKNQESKKQENFKTVSPPKDKSTVFLDDIRLVLPNSDFSNDIFSSLQVPSGSQHHGSLSPTAAFLDAFPLVSNSKNSEMLIDGDNSDVVHHTGESLLQLGDPGENNILDTAGQNCQQVLGNFNNSNIAGTHLAVNSNEVAKNSCSSNNNNQLKTGSIGQQLQTSSHSISALNAAKPMDVRTTEQASKIQDYQSHYNPQYNYLSANTFQNYNCNSGYKKVAPKFADSSNYLGSHNPGFSATNSQQFRDVGKMATTNYGQTNESGLNYNTYNNWNPKSGMQFQNTDDFQTNYMSGYSHFPASGSVSKNVFGSEPSTSTSMFGSLPMYKSTDISENSSFVSQALPVSVSGTRKPGSKPSSTSDAPANFIYTQASTTANPVTTSSYPCVYSSANDFQASVGYPQPFYSSSVIGDQLNTPKAAASKEAGPVVTHSSAVPTSIKSVNSSKPNNSNKFYPSASNSSGKKQSSTFDDSLNKHDQQSNTSTSKSSAYFSLPPTTTINANSFGSNSNSMLTGQNSYQTMNVLSSSSGNTTTTQANSKDGEMMKTSTTSSQQRLPVNWMTMPDPRSSTLEVASSTFMPPDRMFTPHKDVLDFIAPIITGNLQPTYSAINNNSSQMFYGLDFPGSEGQQMYGNEVSKPTSTAAGQQVSNSSSSLHYSWPNNKSSLSLLSHLDNHGLGIPSTLPTLVGDLALGTNIGPSTPAADSGYKTSSNTVANIFQTLPEVEERGGQQPTKSSEMPAKSSNYVIDSQPKSSASFSTDVPSKPFTYLTSNNFEMPSKSLNFPDKTFHLETPAKSSSNFSLQPKLSSNVQSKPSNIYNVQSKSTTFLDTPAKSSNFDADMPSKSSNCLNTAPSKPSNFFDVQTKSSNCLNTKSSSFSTAVQQSNSEILQFERNSEAKLAENSKNHAQNQGNIADSSKMSSNNNNSQQQSGGSFLSVSQLVDQVRTNKKQDSLENGNTYKYSQNMSSDIYCPEISANNSRQSGYKYPTTTQPKGVTSTNCQTLINSKNANNRGSYSLLPFDGINSSVNQKQNVLSFDGTTTNQKQNLLPFDGTTTNQKQSLLSFDGTTTNQKQNLLSFDGTTTNQKQNLVSFDGNTTNQKQNNATFDGSTNQKPKDVPQKGVSITKKSESMIQNNYNNLSSSFLAASSSSTSTFTTATSTSFVTTSLITTNSAPSSSFMTKNSTLPIPVSMSSTAASLWPQVSVQQNSCSSTKKADGFSTKPYKVSNKYSAESLISSENRFVPDAAAAAPNVDHFSTSSLNFGACFEMGGHNSTELPSFGASANLFGSADYHHSDYGMGQNNQPMSSYQNYFGQTLDNLNPSGYLADTADFQMNLFDSSTPYLFPTPTRKEPLQKTNLKTNQKPTNNSLTGFYPSADCYQKTNSNFPPAPNCSSAANLPLSSSTTNSLANFNMSTIFPEMNDKVDAAVAPGGSHHQSHMGPHQSPGSAISVAPQKTLANLHHMGPHQTPVASTSVAPTQTALTSHHQGHMGPHQTPVIATSVAPTQTALTSHHQGHMGPHQTPVIATSVAPTQTALTSHHQGHMGPHQTPGSAIAVAPQAVQQQSAPSSAERATGR